MTLTPEEIESLRIAIAEECGKKKCPYHHAHHIHVGECTRWECSDLLLPYTTSLDAIQKASMDRFKTPNERYNFQKSLSQNDKPAINWFELTALDWSIAFARTAKIWRYKL